MTKTRIKSIESQRFENYLKAIKGFVKTSVIEMTTQTQRARVRGVKKKFAPKFQRKRWTSYYN